MTGTLTRPATTLGSAPSMPATTMMTRADCEAVVLAEQPVDARRRPTSYSRSTSLPISVGGEAASSATGQVRCAGGDDEDCALARHDVLLSAR